MQNLALANAIGFNTGELKSTSLERAWADFKESSLRKFVVLFSEKRVAELQLKLESAKPEEVQKLQGQIFEAKKIRAFLQQESIVAEKNSTAAFLGV